jgi:UDP-3-O-[3-hydroxymyristoyl] glucosamine N-acyltransferase
MALTLSELAKRLGATLEGDGSTQVRGVAGIHEAQPGDVTFVSGPRYAGAVATTKASAVIGGAQWEPRVSGPALLRAADPDQSFTDATLVFAPPPVKPAPGVHPTAVVAPGAVLGQGVSVGPYVVIEPGVRVGARSVLSALCYVGHEVTIGEDCFLYPHVSLRERVRIGNRVMIHNSTVVGSDGFGYSVDANGVRHKIPQVGTVVIGDDVEIGSNVSIDRARFGKTAIGNGVKIDNLVQIAHNVTIGDHAVICGQSGIAGSSEVKAHAILASQAGMSGHLVIGEWAVVGAQAGVTKDVPPKTYVLGSPALPREQMKRNHAAVMRLPHLKEKVADLEARLKALEDKLK